MPGRDDVDDSERVGRVNRGALLRWSVACRARRRRAHKIVGSDSRGGDYVTHGWMNLPDPFGPLRAQLERTRKLLQPQVPDPFAARNCGSARSG